MILNIFLVIFDLLYDMVIHRVVGSLKGDVGQVGEIASDGDQKSNYPVHGHGGKNFSKYMVRISREEW